jgi:hypothetical protein
MTVLYRTTPKKVPASATATIIHRTVNRGLGSFMAGLEVDGL